MTVGGELHVLATLLSGRRVWIYSIGGCVGPGRSAYSGEKKNTPLTGIEIFQSSNCRLLHLLQHPTVPTVGSEGVAVA